MPDDDDKGESSYKGVSILACGYQQVQIAKSGNSFPAWLVQITTATTATTATAKHETQVSWVWRSKRDFWRLARKVSGNIAFPKAAWNKLASTAPWKRPDFDAYVASKGELKESSTCGYDNFRTVIDEASVNNWQPVMKKSLLQIDQFLHKVALETQGTKNKDDPIIKYWNDFVNAKFGETKNHSVASSPRVGNALGQYFCHPSNARHLISTALSCLRKTFWEDDSNGGDHGNKNIYFIEPSCGYGQIVESLLELTVHSPDSPLVAAKNVKVLGIDLDDLAIQKCCEKFKAEDSVDFVQSDFLNSLLPVEWTGLPANERPIVVVIGGPPYTGGAGHGGSDESNLRRDLPMQFVRHAIDAYAATIVCFLMPIRCQRVDYVKEAWIPELYDYESIQLEAPSLFFFQGNDMDPVTQPSIIQCFWKKRDA